MPLSPGTEKPIQLDRIPTQILDQIIPILEKRFPPAVISDSITLSEQKTRDGFLWRSAQYAVVLALKTARNRHRNEAEIGIRHTRS